jgi:2-amino-4-hydroxy-6-hydroxymethyldihydropteridine diphosphokinase
MELLSQQVRVEQVSSIYETEPVGYSEQPRFLNAVCRASTGLTPRELLALAKEIESQMGRKPTFPNAPRPIDVDILFYGEQIHRSPELTIPHPSLTERAFVLVPLAEIAPDVVHPEKGKKVIQLLADAPGVEGVRWWGERSLVCSEYL